MTDAQTEARAIQRYIAPSAGRGAVVQLLKHCDGEWVRYEDHATALAAKDAELIAALHMLDLSKATTEAVLERAERAEAELAAVQVSNNKWLAKWERAEAQLAEANKALEQAEQQLDYGQVDAAHRIIIRATQRAREQGGENNG